MSERDDDQVDESTDELPGNELGDQVEAEAALEGRRAFDRDRTDRLRAYTDCLRVLLLAGEGEQRWRSAPSEAVEQAIEETTLAILADVVNITTFCDHQGPGEIEA